MTLATVERRLVSEGRISIVGVTPANTRSLPVGWMETAADLQVSAGNLGGVWELGRTIQNATFIESIVRAVVAGRVVETSAPGRSRVEVTLEDGSVVHETGYAGCLTVPLPGWRRWGRKVHYAPYS